MRYLLGDSTDSGLEFNYLAFLREVIDAAVVLLEAEGALATNADKKAAKASEQAGLMRAVEELGKDALAVVEPIAKEQPKTPAGRCASAIAKAIKDAVEGETSAAKSAATALADETAREDATVRGKAKTVLEKLLRGHDLPEADRQLDATWVSGGVKAVMRQKTKFGVEVVVSLEVVAGSLFAPELRVDRIAEGVEIHVHEVGGLIKKTDKLVAQKLGRYAVVGVKIAGGATTVQLRATPDAPVAPTITDRGGNILVEGGGGKEYAVEEKDRNGLTVLVEKLGGALENLAEHRTGLVDVLIDNKGIAEHAHPRVLAERLVAAIAPTVQKISRHSRSPGELVLRRVLKEGHREEVYVSISELTKKIDTLPASSRSVFAPLQLGVELATGPVVRAPAEDLEPTSVGPRPQSEKRATIPPNPSAAPRPTGGTRPPPAAVIPPASLPHVPSADAKTEADAKLAASIDKALEED